MDFATLFQAFKTCGSSYKNSRVIYFEGNVGVGKTECMKSVAEMLREKKLSVACVEEDVERWVSEDLLAAKYGGGDMKFNTHALLLSYLIRHKRVKELMGQHDIILVERHPSTSFKVFDVDPQTKVLFDGIAAIVPEFMTPLPTHTVYVKNSARACMERTRRRGRVAERNIDEFTFESWNNLHDDMMRERQAMGGRVDVFDAFGADAHTLTPTIVAGIGLF